MARRRQAVTSHPVSATAVGGPNAGQGHAAPTPAPSRTLLVGGAVAALAVVVAIAGVSAFAAPHAAPTATSAGSTAAPASVAVASAVQIGGLHRTSGVAWVSGGKTVAFFMGAQFCDYCAAERWAFVKATARFGHWSGLGQARSANNIPTYDAIHATYASSILTVQTLEIADMQGQPFQQLTQDQSGYVSAGDPRGSFPFMVIGGRYSQLGNGPGYSPALFSGLSYAQVHHLVYDQPRSTQARAVTLEANAISAAICTTIGARASSTAACLTPAVHALYAA